MSVADYGKKAVNAEKEKLKNEIKKKLLPIILKYVAPVLLVVLIIASALMGGNSGGTSGRGVGVNLDGIDFSTAGNTIQEKVWIKLKQLGYSDLAVAAAMGNIHYESGSFDPTLVEGGYDENIGGIGICQWTNYPRNSTEGRNTDLKKLADKRGKTWQDEDTQVEFLALELTDGSGYCQLADSTYTGTDYYYSEWKNNKDNNLGKEKLNRLTEVFCFTFERPLVEYGRNSMPTRQKYALDYYNEFHGKTWGTIGNKELYNSDKTVNEKKVQALQKQLEKEHNLISAPTSGGWTYVNPLDKRKVKGKYHGYNSSTGYANNGLEPYQCTWWANGRASEYLAKYGKIYKEYPTSSGNGGDYFVKNKASGWFKYGTTPKPNSLLSTTSNTDLGKIYGHVLYIEAVDYKNKVYYASEAGGGCQWGGIQKYSFGYHKVDGNNYGFIYLSEPIPTE